ncbi:hypothetical protein FQR65_LT11958 [Abscondita terminalis]|nr:hypothetical protein FQR65_LT11958 [Abscondita terminalis]
MEKHLLRLCTLFNFVVVITCAYVSPCPGFFKYEEDKGDQWFGTLILSTVRDVSGVVLELQLDRKALQLGNWFGEVSTPDHKSFTIRNKHFVLKAGAKQEVRFYIKYDVNGTRPRLKTYSINGDIVCSKSKEELNIHPPSASTEEDDYYPGDFSFINRSKADENELQTICGTIIARPRPLITYGHLSIEGEFPWHTAIYHAKGFDLTYICGGSLVSKHFVVTVAHCVTKPKTIVPFNLPNLVIYLGKYYLRQFSNAGIQEHSLSKVILHPEFNPETFANDIALLQVDGYVAFTDYVRPVCLWDDDKDLASVIRKKGTVVGWGIDEKGVLTEELMKTTMPIVPQDTCLFSNPDFYSRFTSENTYCAGHRNGTSVCNGDSGGSMAFYADRKWYIRGIVSLAVPLPNFTCDSFNYVVFTDVFKYMDWVKQSIVD